VSKTDPRRDRVAKRIAASQERLTRESDTLSAQPRRDPLPDRDPPENYRSLAREYPWLTVAAGLGVGVLVAALLPRKFASKSAKRAMGLATVAAELGLAYSRQARDAAGEAAHDGLAMLDEGTAPLRQRAVSAGKTVRSRGTRLAGEAIKAVARLRK
jgi:ElaB/YqjD/DUF883 family membrane-anchored ribosome-binding protein